MDILRARAEGVCRNEAVPSLPSAGGPFPARQGANRHRDGEASTQEASLWLSSLEAVAQAGHLPLFLCLRPRTYLVLSLILAASALGTLLPVVPFAESPPAVSRRSGEKVASECMYDALLVRPYLEASRAWKSASVSSCQLGKVGTYGACLKLHPYMLDYINTPLFLHYPY